MALSKDQTIIQVIVPKQFKKELTKVAKKNNRSLSNYIYHFLKDGHPQIKIEDEENNED